MINNKLINRDTSKKIERQSLTIVRTNVAISNKSDVNYLNLTFINAIVIRRIIRDGGDVLVKFYQYETKAKKRRNEPKQVISIMLDSITKLGLRTYTNGKKYYRYKIDGDILRRTVLDNIDRPMTIGTAFSGLGAVEYTFGELSISHTSKYVIDIDKYARQTLIRNYLPEVVLSDITKVDTDKLPSVDFYSFGSPCPDYSQCTSGENARTGLGGPTGRLFWDGYKIVKDTLPKYVIFENVPGLLSVNNSEDFDTIIQAFQDLKHYKIYFKVINPLDIEGVTNRARLFIILIRKDIKEVFHFPQKIVSNRCIKDCLIEGVEHTYLPESELEPYPMPIEEQTGKLKKDFLLKNKTRNSDKQVFNINYPAPTIIRKGIVYINDGIGVRRLTVDELKKIQGFGDALSFEGLSNTQIKNQLGNTMEFQTMKHLISEIVRIDLAHRAAQGNLVSVNNEIDIPASVNNDSFNNTRKAS